MSRYILKSKVTSTKSINSNQSIGGANGNGGGGSNVAVAVEGDRRMSEYWVS